MLKIVPSAEQEFTKPYWKEKGKIPLKERGDGKVTESSYPSSYLFLHERS